MSLHSFSPSQSPIHMYDESFCLIDVATVIVHITLLAATDRFATPLYFHCYMIARLLSPSRSRLLLFDPGDPSPSLLVVVVFVFVVVVGVIVIVGVARSSVLVVAISRLVYEFPIRE